LTSGQRANPRRGDFIDDRQPMRGIVQDPRDGRVDDGHGEARGGELLGVVLEPCESRDALRQPLRFDPAQHRAIALPRRQLQRLLYHRRRFLLRQHRLQFRQVICIRLKRADDEDFRWVCAVERSWRGVGRSRRGFR